MNNDGYTGVVFPQWREQAIELIDKYEPNQKHRYQNGFDLNHYQRLAWKLHSHFKDPTLTQAAFLHGIPASIVFNHADTLGDEISTILQDWRRIRSIRPLNEQTKWTRDIQQLTDLRDERAIFLFVYNGLDFFDPDGKIAEWTKNFYEHPSPLAKVNHYLNVFSAHHHNHDPIAFARNILAPAAEFFGLWQERNVAENAALFFSDPHRFENLLNFTEKCSCENEICDDLVDEVKQAIRVSLHHKLVGNVRWDWHHIGSLDKNLSNNGHNSWEKELFLCGFVTVPCRDEGSCYQILHTLHNHFAFRQYELRDTIGKPTHSGYQALHTSLIISTKTGERSIKVRIIPEKADQCRVQPANEDTYRSARQFIAAYKHKGLRVFTPNGEPKYLPLGATVLNFAYEVFRHWVGFVDYAIINQKEKVDIFHRLKNGDEVRLVLGHEPKTLPKNWEKKVPADSVQGIRRGLAQALHPLPAKRGRTWLRNQVIIHNSLEILDDTVLDVLTSYAVSDMCLHGLVNKEHDANWWMTQLGLLDPAIREVADLFEPAIDQEQADKLVKFVVYRAKTLCVLFPELDIKEKSSDDITAFEKCRICKPHSSSKLVATVMDKKLILHRANQKCAAGGVAIKSLPKISLNQYFVIETTNRVGVAHDVLSVFRDMQVDIVDMAARRLGGAWGVLRIKVDPIGPTAATQILEMLLNINGVKRVVGPDEKRIAILESNLPPREDHARSAGSLPAPYICGPEIEDDAYYYGRSQEMGILLTLWEQIADPRSRKGAAAFVKGPLKVGKTSLVLRFFRQIQSQSDQPYIAVFYKAGLTEKWSSAERKIKKLLLEELKKAAKYWQFEPPKISSRLSLKNVIEKIRDLDQEPVILIAVDEAVGLFYNSQKNRNEIDKLLDFHTLVNNTSGMLAIWIGPTAPTKKLGDQLRSLLQSAQPVETPAFDWRETQEYLEAKKHFPIISIKAKETVAKAAYQLSGGNPYWIAYLGSMMYQNVRSRRSNTEYVVYTGALLADAAEELAQNEVPFIDRQCGKGEGSERDRKYWEIISVLTNLCVTRKEPNLKTPTGVLHKELLARDSTISLAELPDLLDSMRAKGIVEWDKTQPPGWRFVAPLLVEHYKYLLKL